jgi:hypothetical protein
MPDWGWALVSLLGLIIIVGVATVLHFLLHFMDGTF